MQAHVVLVSPCRSASSALGRVLGDDLQAVCQCLRPKDLLAGTVGDGLPGDEAQVCLLDAHGLYGEELEAHVSQCRHVLPDSVLALFNVQPGTMLVGMIGKYGLRGIFSLDDGLDILKKGLHCLFCGQAWIDGSLFPEELHGAQSLPDTQVSPGATRRTITLTPREKEILLLIASGRNNFDIARRLDIRESTVKTHIYNAFQKIGVPNRTQAALWTFQHLYDRPKSSEATTFRPAKMEKKDERYLLRNRDSRMP